MRHINANSLLFDWQSGLRHLHSTTTTMLDVTQIARHCFESKEVLILVLLDFSKAFDTVVLLKAISVTGFSLPGSKIIVHYR